MLANTIALVRVLREKTGLQTAAKSGHIQVPSFRAGRVLEA